VHRGAETACSSATTVIPASGLRIILRVGGKEEEGEEEEEE